MTDARIASSSRETTATAAAEYRVRWRAALVGTLFTALVVVPRWKYLALFPSDLDHLWHAAHAVLSGENPYNVAGPGKAFEWEWGVFYPLPAILLVMPLTVLPVAAARFVFSVVAGAILGYALGPRWRTLWPLFLSQAFFLTVSRNQWSAFMVAAVWWPAIGFVIAAKPNIGLIALAGHRRDTVLRVVLLAGALVVLSFLVRPSWLGEWLALVQSAPNKEIAVLQPGGFLLLAALVLWRTMDGRLLFAASVVPQTPSVYDTLLLFSVCQTRTQAAFLALLTHVAQFTVLQRGPYQNYDAFYDSLAKIIVLLVMIPAVAMALRNRFASAKDSRGRDARGATTTRNATFSSPAEAVLLFLLALVFLLQWWIIYGQWLV